MLVGTTGVIHAFGRNNHGQLGTGDLADRHTPQLVECFENRKVFMVAAGFYHTLILVGQLQDEPEPSTHNSDFPTFSASSILAKPNFVQAGQSYYESTHSENTSLNAPLNDGDFAIFILAHLDLQASASEVPRLPTSASQPPETLQLLLGLLLLLYKTGYAQERHVQGTQISTHDVVYMLTAALRILRAALKNLLLKQTNIDELRKHPSPIEYGHWFKKAEIARQQDQISMPCATIYNSYKFNLYQDYNCALLLEGRECESANNLDINAQECRTAETLHCLQHQILLLIQTPIDLEVGNNIQQEAADVLFVGLEIFYPCHIRQIQLISELLQAHDSSAASLPSAGCNPLTGRWAARHLLLHRLLARLSDDAVASSYVRSTLCESSEFERKKSRENGFGRLQPFSNSVRMLMTLNKLLIKHLISSDTRPATAERSLVGLSVVLKDAALAIQKYLFHWAAYLVDLRTPTQPGEISMSPLHLSSATLLSHTETSGGLQCLYYYCRLIFTQSVAFLCGRSRVTALHGENFAASRFESQTLDLCVEIQQGPSLARFACLDDVVMGLLLRHVLNGLLPFTHITNLASELVGPVVRLSQLLNISWQQVAKGAAPYNCNQSLGQQPGPGTFSPWLEDLACTSATLAGSMAAALASQCNCTPTCSTTNLSRFGEGFKPNWLHALVQQRVLPTAIFSACSGGQRIFHEKRLHIPCFCLNSGKFVDSLVAGRGPGGRFCRWLREFYCAFDPAYLTLTRQAIKVKLHPIIWDIERAVAALLFKNNDYEAQLCLYASRTNNDALSKRAAPRRFLVLWSGVARTTAWLWHHKSTLRASQSDDSLLFPNTLVHVLILLSFQSPTHEFDGLIGKSRQENITCLLDTRSSAMHEDHSRWRRAIVRVVAIVRWKTSCVKNLSGLIPWSVCKMTQSLVKSLAPLQVGEHTKIPDMVQDTLETYHCTMTRQDGMLALCALASSLTVPRLLVCALYPLPGLLKFFNPPGEDLRPCRELRSHVCVSLWGELCNLMRQRLDIMQTARCTSSDDSMILLFVAAFGQASTCKDLNNLSDIKLIQTLHRLLLYLNDGMAPLINNAEEYTPGKSTDMNNDKHARAIQTRSFNATWALLRNFGISMTWSAARMEEEKQHGHAPIHPAIQLENKTIVGLFCVYQDVGWKALASLRDANVMDLKISASNNQHVDNPNSISSHPRRCQEIISTPMRLASSDDGIQIGAENIISNPKGTDLSFTCWLYLLQNTTGYHRVVLLRGTETTFRPILLIRDKDMRLEVGFGSSTSFEMERLASKERLPLACWTHIGLVIEGSKVRLYLNGILDNQHTCNSKVVDVNSLPVHVGSLTDNIGCSFEGVNGSVEGYIARLRFYTRALSPIHLRIVCDQGPPGACQAGDYWSYQLSTVILVTASVKLGRVQLSNSGWLNLLYSMMNEGTARIQQVVARTLRLVLPKIDPATCDSPTVRPASLFSAFSLLQHSFGMISAALCLSLKEKNTFLVGAGGKLSNDDNDSALFGVPLIASELVCLFRLLWASPRWKAHVSCMIYSKLSASACPVCDQIAALGILGGHSGGIDSGTVVSLLSGGINATVIEFDHLTCRAVVTSCGNNSKGVSRSPSEQFSHLLRPSHVHADKLAVQLAKPTAYQGWTVNFVEQCLAPQIERFIAFAFDVLQSPLQISHDVIKCDKLMQSCSLVWGHAQRCTHCVKILHALSVHPSLVDKAITWPGMLNVLLRLCTQVVSYISIHCN